MRVLDVLRIKGQRLHTIDPRAPLQRALLLMSELDIGSLVVTRDAQLVGLLTFREVVEAASRLGPDLFTLPVSEAMDPSPAFCSPRDTLDEARRRMISRHARYLPVMEAGSLVGLISFFDIARAVIAESDRAAQHLLAYISDQPLEVFEMEHPSLAEDLSLGPEPRSDSILILDSS